MSLNRWIIALGAVLVLVAINMSIASKERIIHDGEVVLLDLAPVDPRSLVQGDYMALRFRLADQIIAQLGQHPPASAPMEGAILYATVTLDAARVANLAAPGQATPYKIRYRLRNAQAWLGTNAFFFEEGSASRYAQARYGEFRLDAATGEAVLVGLRDANQKPLQ